ncbi:MAG: hypothetical protein JO089_03235 [Alphaproteobacteria bacterium]|nr:hypothetical protein [Alphaproteobacteria bacterium]
MRDLYDNINVLQVLAPQTATSAKTSAAIDLQGYNSALVTFAVGAPGDTLSSSVYWTLSLQESTDGVTYTPVMANSAPDMNNTVSIALTANGQGNQAYKLGYIGSARYLKALATPTGTMTNGTPISMVALRGTAGYKPVS